MCESYSRLRGEVARPTGPAEGRPDGKLRPKGEGVAGEGRFGERGLDCQKNACDVGKHVDYGGSAFNYPWPWSASRELNTLSSQSLHRNLTFASVEFTSAFNELRTWASGWADWLSRE